MNTVVLEKDTQGNLVPVSVMAKLSSNRKLFLFGDINNEKASDVVTTLLFLASQQVQDNTITLFVSSFKSDLQSVFMIIDCIQNLSCPVKIICMGQLDGFSTLLLTVGESKMTESSTILLGPIGLYPNVHQTQTADCLLKRAKAYDKAANILLSKKMKKPIKEIKSIFEKTIFLSAKEALKLNLIDSIVTSSEEE